MPSLLVLVQLVLAAGDITMVELLGLEEKAGEHSGYDQLEMLRN